MAWPSRPLIPSPLPPEHRLFGFTIERPGSDQARGRGRRDLRRRRGLGAVEVIVVIGIVGFAFLWLLASLPRWRETARMAACQKNLMQIGVAVQLYHQASRHYPTVPVPGVASGDSPVAAMLNSLSLPDFLDLRDPTQAIKASTAAVPGLRVPGLACPSDSSAMAGAFATPISYRADAGDTTDGHHGPFEPGRGLTSGEIEAGRGLSFVSGFAERLVGTGRDREPTLANYATGPGTIAEAGCVDAPSARWRGDAGSNWGDPGWRSALFNHTLSPNAPGSCASEDGRTASMGVSSGHPNRINVLMMDGSLRGVTPTIDAKVWRALGTVGGDSNPQPGPVKAP